MRPASPSPCSSSLHGEVLTKYSTQPARSRCSRSADGPARSTSPTSSRRPRSAPPLPARSRPGCAPTASRASTLTGSSVRRLVPLLALGLGRRLTRFLRARSRPSRRGQQHRLAVRLGQLPVVPLQAALDARRRHVHLGRRPRRGHHGSERRHPRRRVQVRGLLRLDPAHDVRLLRRVVEHDGRQLAAVHVRRWVRLDRRDGQALDRSCASSPSFFSTPSLAGTDSSRRAGLPGVPDRPRASLPPRLYQVDLPDSPLAFFLFHLQGVPSYSQRWKTAKTYLTAIRFNGISTTSFQALAATGQPDNLGTSTKELVAQKLLSKDLKTGSSGYTRYFDECTKSPSLSSCSSSPRPRRRRRRKRPERADLLSLVSQRRSSSTLPATASSSSRTRTTRAGPPRARTPKPKVSLASCVPSLFSSRSLSPLFPPLSSQRSCII